MNTVHDQVQGIVQRLSNLMAMRRDQIQLLLLQALVWILALIAREIAKSLACAKRQGFGMTDGSDVQSLGMTISQGILNYVPAHWRSIMAEIGLCSAESSKEHLQRRLNTRAQELSGSWCASAGIMASHLAKSIYYALDKLGDVAMLLRISAYVSLALIP